MQSTYMPKEDDLERQWVLFDADGVVLGRLASRAARILRGKHKPEFTPHLDCGDGVIVINAAGIEVTGNKKREEFVRDFSGYIGGLRERPLGEVLDEDPEDVVKRAIRGMIPKNRLGKKIGKHLRVYEGAEHPHEAQEPVPYDWETEQIRDE